MQTTMKYRDEQNPRYGLLRCREFMMKDMYSFDADEASAQRTYEQVCAAYDRLFASLGVRFVKASGDSGTMGGSVSHEYHIPAPCGEDRVRVCRACHTATNMELVSQSDTACANAQCGQPTETVAAIEVGHCFRLGTRYSAVLNARFVDSEQQLRPLDMGCFGIGVTRLLAACVEQCNPSGSKNAAELLLPHCIAPYRVCVVTPKRGSKEQFSESETEALLQAVFGGSSPNALDDVLLDDRELETIGMRVRDCRRIGVPFVLVLGRKTRETMCANVAEIARTSVELIDVHANKTDLMSIEQLRSKLPDLLA